MKTFYKKVVMWLFVGQWAMSALQAQHLTAYEYWFDDQIAGRTQVRQNQRSSELLLTDSVLVSGLSTGIHRLNLRFKNDSAWSSVQQSFFLKSDAAVSDAVLVEYWLDSDMTRRFTQTMSGVLMGFDSVSLPALRDGFHTLSMRFRQSEQWSSVTQSTFMKQSQGASAGSVVCEYWLDDPRQGVQQQVLPFQSGAQIIWFDSLNVQQAAAGIHSLNVRFKQGTDWSAVSQSFFLKSALPNATIACEYWFDDALTRRKSLPLTPLQNWVVLDSVLTDSLTQGMHRLNLRFRGQSDWSAVSQHAFYKLPAPSSNQAVLCEYWFNREVQRRQTQWLRANDVLFIDSVNVSHLCSGQNVLNTRFWGGDGWSAVTRDTFRKQSPTLNMPYADFSFRLSPDSYAVYFADSSLNAMTHRWNFGDGSFDTVQMNPAHRYANPGVYQVCRKIGNPNTYPCQEDSICKTVGIRGINSIIPTNAANTGFVILKIQGFGFERADRLELYKDSTNVILRPDSLFYTSATNLRANFNFQNAPVGVWSMRVIKQIDTFYLHRSFTLEPVQTAEFAYSVQIIGASRILRNREFDYRIAITNNSNVMGLEIPILIVSDENLSMRLTNPIYDSPAVSSDAHAALDRFNGVYSIASPDATEHLNYSAPVISYVPPNTTTYINVKAKCTNPTATSVYINAAVGKPMANISLCSLSTGNQCKDAWAKFLVKSAGIVNPLVSCLDGVRDIYCNDIDRVRNVETNSAGAVTQTVWDVGKNVVSALSGCTPVAKAIKGGFSAMKNLLKLELPQIRNWRAGGVGDAVALGIDALGWIDARKEMDSLCFMPSAAPNNNYPIEVVNSIDPNLKEGPKGINNLNCVSGESLMPFTIYYENSDSATAPASEVYVIDTLDRTKFDISTFRFTEFAFSDSVYYLQTAAKSFVRDIDMRPRKNIILRVSGDLDSTGIVQWSFKSFDPRTMDLTQNIDDGFLPPNRRKPEGEGRVGYTIRLQTGLPHLTTIRNKAAIIFDVNAPIVTPTWTNTVDRVPPVSRVTHIARTARDTVFTVHWTGVDPHAGILDYTVYVSENGSPFMEWLANTSSDSAQFIGTRGRIYDFYVRARDYVGNIETKLPLAEASTGRVSTEPVPVAANWLGQNRPNPSSGTTQIDFYLAEYASKVQLDVYNLAGIKVKTVLNHAFVSGLHTVSLDLKGLPTGIYFYRLETDLFNETKRMLIVD